MSTSTVPLSGVKTHQKRWTSEEDQAFLDGLHFCGYGKWTQIARILGNRTALQVKNRARHLILYETGTELSAQLRALEGSCRSSSERSSGPVYSPVTDESNESSCSEDELDLDEDRIRMTETVVDVDDFVNVVEAPATPFYNNETTLSSPTINPSLIASPPSIISSPMPIRPNRAADMDLLPTPSPSPSELDPSEHMLNSDFISERERMALPEFFQGSSTTRTPERFLKIRSTILRLWVQHRPQSITKLAARVALRGIAGDVGLISKVHGFLEETNLINSAPPPKLKTTTTSTRSASTSTTATTKSGRSTMKPREEPIAVRATSVPLTYRRPRTRALGLDPFELMRLAESQAGSIHFSPLVFTLMHVHAFLSRQEVIGVLGGCQRNGSLHITQVYPCKSQVSSGMECEMDPFAEMRACEMFVQRGCSMVGWYHSHPTFPSNPSRRDLETQSLYQKLYESPPDCCAAPKETAHSTLPSFIGAIVSPWGNRKEIELTCFQSTGFAGGHVHHATGVNGEALKWAMAGGEQVDVEQWHKAFRELFEVEGVRGVPEADRIRLVDYLLSRIPLLADMRSDLISMMCITATIASSEDQ